MDCDQMFELLKSEDPDLQREGAFMAGEEMSKAAIPFLSALLTSPNLGVQDAADMSLRKIGGREVVEAVIPLLRSEDVPIRNLSMDILRQIGSQNIEPIIALLKDEDPDIRIFCSDILGSTDDYMAVHPLCGSLVHDTEINVRYQAAVSLGELGKPEATESLNKALGNDDWVNFAVIEALMKIRDEASITALMGALDKSSELVASIIIDALGEIGQIRSVPVLVKYLGKAAPVLRNKTLKAVVNIMGSKALSFLSKEEKTDFAAYLIAAADDEDQEIQDAVIVGLSSLGGEDAFQKIFSLATGIDPEVEPERYARAINALVSMGFSPVLHDGCRSDDERNCRVAVEVLIRLGTPDAAGECMDVFWDKGRDIQRAIAKGIANTAFESAKPFFSRVLRDATDGDVLKSALTFLGKRMRSDDVLDEIVPFLDHRFNDVKDVALDACVTIGGEKAEAVFKSMANQDDPVKRMMGLYGLGKLDIVCDVDLFEQALDDGVVDVRKVAMEALVSLCASQPDVLSRVLARMIDDESEEIRRSLVDLVGSSGCPGAVPFLVRALDDGDDWVKIRAIESLGRLGREEAIPSLIVLLGSSTPLVGIKVVENLGRIGGERAFQELLRVLETDDQDLQEAAERALDTIQAQNGGEI